MSGSTSVFLRLADDAWRSELRSLGPGPMLLWRITHRRKNIEYKASDDDAAGGEDRIARRGKLEAVAQ